jgi:hypothetical protein
VKKKRQAAPLEIQGTPDRVKSLQSFLSCLFYLTQEAEREGFAYIKTVLKETIAKIDLLSRGESVLPQAADVIDDSLYEAMAFLHSLADLSAQERCDFMKIYEELRRTTGARGKRKTVLPSGLYFLASIGG